MWMSAPTAHNIYGSIFVSNVAEFGGAVWLTSTENISREFEECLFEGNEATDGGALYFYTSAGTDIISSSAFSYNHAGDKFLDSANICCISCVDRCNGSSNGFFTLFDIAHEYSSVTMSHS